MTGHRLVRAFYSVGVSSRGANSFKKYSGPVAAPSDTGFDFVRLSPHFAQDDNVGDRAKSSGLGVATVISRLHRPSSSRSPLHCPSFTAESQRHREKPTQLFVSVLFGLHSPFSCHPPASCDLSPALLLLPYRAFREKNSEKSIAAHLNCRILCAAN